MAPVQFQNSNQIQNTSSAHILAPDSAPLRIIETEEELEVKRVSLFVEILSFEFAKHRGYKAEN